MRRLFLPLFTFALIALAGCGKPQPPMGKWEGGLDRDGTIVVARVEILANGSVRVSAPDITNLENAKPEQLEAQRERLSAELVTAWDGVAPREFTFDGKIFRKPGGFAPQMVWDKATNQMTLELYLGANPALPVTLRAVDGFHDNPFGSG